MAHDGGVLRHVWLRDFGAFLPESEASGRFWSVGSGADRGGRWRRPGRLIRDLEAVGLLVVIAVASALLLLPRGDDGLLGLPELQPGELAPRTVRSVHTFPVVDPVLTRDARERARANVLPVFDHVLGLWRTPVARLEAVFASVTSSVAKRPLAAHFGIEVDPRTLGALIESDRPSAVLDAASMLLEAAFQRRLVSDPGLLAGHGSVTVRSIDAEGQVTGERRLLVEGKGEVLGPNQARALVDTLGEERLGHLNPRERAAVSRVAKSFLTPNFVPNAQETLRRRQLAWQLEKPRAVLVNQGDRILRAGEPVTDRELLFLNALRKLESPQSRLQSVLGSAILGVVLAFLAYRSARHAYRHRLPKKRDLVFLASVFVAYLLVLWAGLKVDDVLRGMHPIEIVPDSAWRLLIPLPLVAIVVRMAAGPVAATAVAPVAGLLAGWMMGGDLNSAAVALVGSLAAASTEPGAKRTVVAAGFRAGLAQAAMVVATHLLNARFALEATAVSALFALLGGLLAAPLARSVLPAIEALFGYTMPTGLAVFADAEHPLLRELLVEVPGTYHHSLLVGTLAEAGARSIGSDRLLARVGGYLHDVGRLKGPGTPEERRRAAARIASEHRFPPELAQILAEQPHELSVEGRRPKPRSKTAALVALADRIEDALAGREGEFETGETLEATVRGEVRAAVSSRILDDAALELRELAAVSKAFTGALTERFVHADGRPPGWASPASGDVAASGTLPS